MPVTNILIKKKLCFFLRTRSPRTVRRPTASMRIAPRHVLGRVRPWRVGGIGNEGCRVQGRATRRHRHAARSLRRWAQYRPRRVPLMRRRSDRGARLASRREQREILAHVDALDRSHARLQRSADRLTRFFGLARVPSCAHSSQCREGQQPYESRERFQSMCGHAARAHREHPQSCSSVPAPA